MATVAPSPAPAATPSRNGSASELRSTPWYEVPPAASIAPTSAASTTRGSRSCHTIAWSTGDVAVWKSRNGRWAKIVPTTSPTLMFTGPTAVASSIAPSSTAVLIPPSRIRARPARWRSGAIPDPNAPSARRVAAAELFARALIAGWSTPSRLPATGSARRSRCWMLLEGRGNRAEQVHDARPPAGGDRVVDGDDPRAAHGRQRRPARALTHRRLRLLAAAGIGEEDVVG